MFKWISWIFFWRTEQVVKPPVSASIAPVQPSVSTPSTTALLTSNFLDDASDGSDNKETNKSLDRLGRFMGSLTRLRNDLPKGMVEWEKLNEKISENNSELKEYNLNWAEHNQALLHEMKAGKSYFQNILEKLLQGIESADHELHQQIQIARDHIEKPFVFLENGCLYLEDSKITEQEKKQRCLDMRWVGIEILKDFQELVEEVLAELNYCLRVEEITESTAWRLIRFLFFAKTGIVLPEIDLNAKVSYRNMLYQEIKNEKYELDVLKTRIGMILEKAMSAITQVLAKHPSNEVNQDKKENNNEQIKRPSLFETVENKIVNEQTNSSSDQPRVAV